LERGLSAELRANREEALKWYGEGQWGRDVVAAIDGTVKGK